ncbi:uncharacterized protein A4U43_C03F18500 [Asparagus officinalis]|uniref:Uncharacterized protein n=1 Tax=Asparagus officinalis TaxID=4686 RepID=A0A5P1FG98_ASPOF|nr:uncharacterized protein A4U43_C03F18500 [Asparagus officinalis]
MGSDYISQASRRGYFPDGRQKGRLRAGCRDAAPDASEVDRLRLELEESENKDRRMEEALQEMDHAIALVEMEKEVATHARFESTAFGNWRLSSLGRVPEFDKLASIEVCCRHQRVD